MEYEYQTLMRFYAVDTEIDLIKTMEDHILKLQQKLAKEQSFSFVPQRVREG